MRIIAFDPGKNTGYVTANLFDDYLVIQEKATLLELVKIWQLLWLTQPEIVIYESFVYRRLLHVDLTPREVIGVIKLWGKLNNCTLVSQAPSGVKAFVTNERLKELGVYVRNPHTRDAVRHLIYHVWFKYNIQDFRMGK